jgi:nucleotide-binding universal stress UspA family protein
VPAERIVRIARSRHADLVVIGTMAGPASRARSWEALPRAWWRSPRVPY